MENSDFSPNNPVVQLEVMKERLKNLSSRFSQQEERLKDAYITIGEQNATIKRATEEYHDMRVTLEGTKRELTHAKQALNQSNRTTSNKDRQAKWRTFLASILFLIASILGSVGTGMVVSTPPNALGWALIVLGSMIYIVATVFTTLLA